ncbi:MAG TPA: serine/threonine-protein kinase [Acidobacteriaceae bacterium]|nr:serine/threonine-protein kinase [Acidobacteriaceae bacterium]
MISERWQRVKDVLGAVDGLSAPEREAALEELCGDDPQLRGEVDSLLAQEDRIELLSEPADHAAYTAAEPQQVGPWRIERLLGSGGMGTVYLAARSDDAFEKKVAVKVIQSLRGNQLARRFETERRILATLEHPAIARLLDGGTLSDGRPYLVMEYVDGRPIDQYVDEHNPDLETILRLFLKVCDAVQYAHQNFVVHRDLKAGNILVTSTGDPRLLDFGIAKLLTGVADEAEETRPFERLLTPYSASPEQIAGGRVTTASDVYSLGLLLYRLLTGISAYASAPDFRTRAQEVILHYDPPLASKTPSVRESRRKQLRGDLDTILSKALEKDVARRYRTVEELSSDLRNFLEGRPVRARRASRLYVARKFVRRNRVQVAAAALVLLAIAAGLTGTILYARRAEQQRAIALRRLQTLRHISESLLFEFHDSIRDLPGSTQARALVVRRALEYLNELASEDSKDPSVRRDLAAAYVRIGAILAGERGSHLGGPDAFQVMLTSYERALAIRRSLAASNPADPALRKELLESLWDLASVRQAQGELNEALQLQRERLQVIEHSPQPENHDSQYSRAATYAEMSELERTQGHYSEALALSQSALGIREALLRADPQNRRWQRAVGLSQLFQGYALSSLHQFEEAAREDEQALATFKALAATDRTNTDLMRNVGVSEMVLCENLARSGSGEQALPHCQTAINIMEHMHHADSSNIQANEDMAAAYATMGFALHRAKQLAPARVWERRADAEFQAALAKDPDANESDAIRGQTLVEWARIENELHLETACSHLQQARELLQKLASAYPADANIQEELSQAQSMEICH